MPLIQIRTFVPLAMVFPLLLAVGCSAKPPGCSDSNVVATAELLISQQLHDDLSGLPSATPHPNQRGLRHFNVGISEIRTAGFDQSVKKVFCSGTLSISPTDEIIAIFEKEDINWPQILRSRITFGTARVNHYGVHEAVIYSVQNTDDKKHFYVQFEDGGMDALVAAKEFAILSQIIQLNSR